MFMSSSDKLGESYTQDFFSSFCSFHFFFLSVSLVIFPKTVVFLFQWNSDSDALEKIPKELL